MLSDNAIKVLEARYLRRDERGQLAETPDELFRRVARAVAGAEKTDRQKWEEEFYAALAGLDFLPNSPTLMNAGLPLGQLSACFVLPVGDSMEEIFDALKLMALVQQSGGGTGFSFSRLRPKGDRVHSTGGAASGPVSFMRIFDCATDNIRQGGKRRGANMGILRVDHPDIEEFVTAKLDGTSFRNFNISVGATDAFMTALQQGGDFELRHPKDGRVRTLPAAELFAEIVEAAWRTGDPGLIFLDTINRHNPTPALGPIEATNPCGELPLLPYEACNLASLNLARLVKASGTIDWERLGRLTRLAVRFLDDVIDISRWPSPRITAMTQGNRKIGLGVMGFAEMLLEMGVPYAAPRALAVAEELMRFIAEQARAASADLARERGVFPNWERSIYAPQGLRLRNATRTSIAPTGSISIIAGTSASIEPLFALAYHRHALDGQILTEVNPLVLRHAREKGFYSPEFVRQLEERGTLAGIPGVPPETRELFRTALEIAPEDHLRIQVAFQKHSDNAVSKTINLPEQATVADVDRIYRQAWEAGLKGITIFRYGSKGQQVLELGTGETAEEHEHFARCNPESCKL